MSIVATDLVVYASANIPDVDTGTNGGAIDAKRRVVFTQMASNDTVRAVSTSASDTSNITVTGRAADGTIKTETKALTGTTPITFTVAGTLERLLKADMAADAVGTITVAATTGPTTLGTIPPGERGFFAHFINCAADVAAGSSRDFYRKVFYKNANGTLALLAAQIAQASDSDARVTHALVTTVNDSGTATDRRTAPASVSAFDDTAKNVATTDLASGAAQGVWLKLTLPAGDPSHRATYGLQATGNTT